MQCFTRLNDVGVGMQCMQVFQQTISHHQDPLWFAASVMEIAATVYLIHIAFNADNLSIDEMGSGTVRGSVCKQLFTAQDGSVVVLHHLRAACIDRCRETASPMRGRFLQTILMVELFVDGMGGMILLLMVEVSLVFLQSRGWPRLNV